MYLYLSVFMNFSHLDIIHVTKQTFLVGVGNGVQYLGGRYQCLSAELGGMWSLTPKSGGTLFGAKGHMILEPPF